jgi:hypothetical protein
MGVAAAHSTAHTLEVFWEFSGCPKNGCHFNRLILNSVHYAKSSNDDFANFRFISLRHNTSRAGKTDQLLDSKEDSRNR